MGKRYHQLTITANESVLDDSNYYFAVDKQSVGTPKLPANTIAKRSVQNNLVSSFAETFDPLKFDGYESGDIVEKEGALYMFNKTHVGAWVDADADKINDEVAFARNSKKHQLDLLPITITSGKYIDKIDGSLVSEWGDYTAHLEIADYAGKSLAITARAGFNTCILALYDENDAFVASFGKVPTSGYINWKERVVHIDGIIAAYPTAKYIAFCSWPKASVALKIYEYHADVIDNVFNKLLDEDAKLDAKFTPALPTTGEVQDLGFTINTGYFIDKTNGALVEYNNTAQYTDKIDISTLSGKVLAISAAAKASTCIYAVYNENNTCLGTYGKVNDSTTLIWTGEQVAIDDILATHPTAKYIAFGSWPKASMNLYVGEFIRDTADDILDKALGVSSLHSKKWCACGDSFTEGGNIEVDPETGIHKSYPWWIAKRNGMELVMMAKGGERIQNSGSNHFTPTKYQSIPLDSDIVTLSFGLNGYNVTIGDYTSTDNTTLWGAFNEVMTWIMQNIPACKVGIIISDGWMPTNIAEAEKEIASYWGVPCLDLKYDVNVPLGISGSIDGVAQVRPNTSNVAQGARNTAFRDETAHPNAAAHKYRSTFIEAFLKNL